MANFIAKGWKSRLARNAFWMLLGQGLNFGLQAAFFILLARFLGVTEYGIFAGAFALVNVVTPYSTLGASMLFMRYVSADRADARVYWGNSVVTALLLSVVLACALSYAGPKITGAHSWSMFFVLAIANCLFAQMTSLASAVFQTFENMRPAAMLGVLSNLARLIVLLAMETSLHHATAIRWAYGVLVASGCAAALSFVWVSLTIGTPRISPRLIWRRTGEGIGFSFAGTTQTVYNDIDKTMLSHYGLNRENGFYTLAYRIVDFATAPIQALDSVVLPRYFNLSREGLRPIARLAVRTLWIALAAGLTIALLTLLAAPVVPHLVGRDFSQALVALRWLCWLPLLRGIHRLTGGALTATGSQNLRTIAQFVVACVNIGLNMWWISSYGWIGAAWSSVACDALLGVLNGTILYWLWRRNLHREANSPIVAVGG